MDDFIQIKREDLYEQVWITPMVKLAKEYGISDVGLKKICKKLHIPVPERGYWQKKESGKPVRKTPLPHVPQCNNSYTLRKRPLPENETDNEMDAVIMHERLEENRVKVPKQLISPHPYTIRTEKELRKAKPNIKGLIKPIAKECLDIQVSVGNLDRALRIMDTLIKALESRGHKVFVSGKDRNETTTSVLGEDIKFCLIESVNRKIKDLSPTQKREREKHPWLYSTPEYEYYPSGKLFLQISHEWLLYGIRRTWSDGTKGRIETLLNSFIIGLAKAALEKRSARLQRERREREWEEEKRRVKEAEKQREEENKLGQLAELWHKSNRIREYVNAFKESYLQRVGEILPDSSIYNWLIWALNYADRIDPLSEENFSIIS